MDSPREIAHALSRNCDGGADRPLLGGGVRRHFPKERKRERRERAKGRVRLRQASCGERVRSVKGEAEDKSGRIGLSKREEEEAQSKKMTIRI